MDQDNHQANKQENNEKDPAVLQQPDADRSSWHLKTLNYDETIAVLNGEQAVQPEFNFADEVLAKIKKEKPQINSDDPLDRVIEDKYQQILLARYNVDQERNVTVSETKSAKTKA